jgi:hypothetical protein
MVDQIDWKAIANLNENELSDLSGESEKFPLENVGKTV